MVCPLCINSFTLEHKPVGVPPRQLDTHSFASFYYSFRLGLIPLSHALFVKYMFFPPVILPISHYVFYTLDSGEKLLEDIRFSQTLFPNLRQNLQFRVIIYILRQTIHDVYIRVRGNRMDNQEWIESRDTDNIVHTRNRAKTNKTKTKTRHDT
jgi:hypothetical protein